MRKLEEFLHLRFLLFLLSSAFPLRPTRRSRPLVRVQRQIVSIVSPIGFAALFLLFLGRLFSSRSYNIKIFIHTASFHNRRANHVGQRLWQVKSLKEVFLTFSCLFCSTLLFCSSCLSKTALLFSSATCASY